MEVNKEKNKKFNFSLKPEFFLDFWDRFFFSKMKIYFFKILKMARRNMEFFSSEKVKIFSAGMLTAATIIWIGNYDFFDIAHSEEMENAEVKEEMNLIIPEEKKVNAEAVNQYKFKLADEQCKEDKDQKKTSELCGKDDEEEVKRLEKEMQEAIVRKNYKPKIKAPMPAVFAIDSRGRMVCNRKNDRPGKSKQDKGKHMDMECCLDPDEYPNPNCYYDPKKYGKYL